MNRTLAFAAALFVQIIYGFTFTFANDVIDGGHVKPFGFILLRAMGAFVLFWLVSFLGPKEKVEIRDYITIFFASIFGVALNMLSFFKGFQYTTPIHASVIMTVVPIVVLVLSAWFLRETITQLKIIGILFGCVGAIALSVFGKELSKADNILVGNALVFVNACSYSIYLILIKNLVNRYHPITFMKWLFTFGLILVLPFGYDDLVQVQVQEFDFYTVFSILFVIVGATFGTYILNPLAMQHLKASTVSTFIYLQPVFAAIFAIAMGSDALDWIKVIAAMFIFVGVYLVSYRKKQLS